MECRTAEGCSFLYTSALRGGEKRYLVFMSWLQYDRPREDTVVTILNVWSDLLFQHLVQLLTNGTVTSWMIYQTQLMLSCPASTFDTCLTPENSHLFLTPFSLPLSIQEFISNFSLSIEKYGHLVKFIGVLEILFTPGRWI